MSLEFWDSLDQVPSVQGDEVSVRSEFAYQMYQPEVPPAGAYRNPCTGQFQFRPVNDHLAQGIWGSAVSSSQMWDTVASLDALQTPCH